MSQTNWTLIHRWQWLDRAADHIWRHSPNSKLLAHMFVGFQAVLTSSLRCVCNLWWRQKPHLGSRVQSCGLLYSLSSFELRRLLSDPAGSLIYCINLVTWCMYNKVISLHILFNHFLLIRTDFCSLSWRWRPSVPTYWQHGLNPEDNLNLVTHFNFS